MHGMNTHTVALNFHLVRIFLYLRLQSFCKDPQQWPFNELLPPPDWAWSPPCTGTTGQAFYVTSASTEKRFSLFSDQHQFFPFSAWGHVPPMFFVTVLCVFHK